MTYGANKLAKFLKPVGASPPARAPPEQATELAQTTEPASSNNFASDAPLGQKVQNLAKNSVDSSPRCHSQEAPFGVGAGSIVNYDAGSPNVRGAESVSPSTAPIEVTRKESPVGGAPDECGAPATAEVRHALGTREVEEVDAAGAAQQEAHDHAKDHADKDDGTRAAAASAAAAAAPADGDKDDRTKAPAAAATPEVEEADAAGAAQQEAHGASTCHGEVETSELNRSPQFSRSAADFGALLDQTSPEVAELQGKFDALLAEKLSLEEELGAAKAEVSFLRQQNQQLQERLLEREATPEAAPATEQPAVWPEPDTHADVVLERPSAASLSKTSASQPAAQGQDVLDGGDLGKLQRSTKGSNERLLLAACRVGRLDLVQQTLADYTVDRNVTTFGGDTPLYLAAERGDFHIVEALLKFRVAAGEGKAANPDMPIKNGITPLFAAATAGHAKVVQLLLENGAKASASVKSQGGNTALHSAAFRGHTDVVQTLLEYGASVNPTNKDSYTPLHLAAREGKDYVASMLINSNAQVNAVGKDGWTPLHKAAQQGQLDVVKLLVANGADLSRKDNPTLGFLKRTAEDWAKKKGFTAVAQELRKSAEEDARRRSAGR